MPTATTSAAPARPDHGQAEQAPVRVVRAEHVRAFEDLYAKYWRRVQRALWRRAEDWDLAADLTQDVFTYLWERIRSGAIDMDAVDVRFAWIMSWGRGPEAQHYNSPIHRNETTCDDSAIPDRPDLSAPDPADVVTGHAGIVQLLAGVPQRTRLALVLHVLADRPVAEIAEVTGLSEAEVTAQVQAGIDRARELLGVTPDQLAARAEATRNERAHRHLAALASPPLERTAEFRTDLCAAIAAGTYPPGTRLPTPKVLAQTFPPRRHQIVDQDCHLIPPALERLSRTGILTGTPTTGYRVAANGPSLAAAHSEALPATATIARELLAGIWAPGTRLPARAALGKRWRTSPDTLAARLDALVQVGALARTVDGHYRVPYSPGTAPAVEADAPITDAQILAELAALPRVPTLTWIRATYPVGYRRAVNLRTAAAHAAEKQATVARRATTHAKRAAASARQALTAKADA
jgi:RNA polymerase sigma factor (sigma-70 family)